MHPSNSFYTNEGPFRVPLPEDIYDAVQDQIQDNSGALYARLQAIGFQVAAGSVDKRDLLALLSEMTAIPTSMLADNFGVGHEQLMAIRSAEPVSIMSCLHCQKHLPDTSRKVLFRQLGRLRYLGRFEVGDLVEHDSICELLCEANGCSHNYRARIEEELRTAYLSQKRRRTQLIQLARTQYKEYLKTVEWGAKRTRALIQAGNRCQVCSSTDGLAAHHRTYERLGDELLSDLIVLCSRCHKLYHGIISEAA